jgi:hypothetical protein
MLYDFGSENFEVRTLRYHLNLTGNKFLEMEYLFVSTAAFRVPEHVGESLSVLIFGFIFHHPEEFPSFCDALPVAIQSHMPTELYYRGWAKLTFQGVRGGDVKLYPYRPRFPPGDMEPLLDADGTPVQLLRNWPIVSSPSNFEYILSCSLENPFGGMRLCIVATGNVELSVDPTEFVLASDMEGRPEMGFDETRQSLINSIE